MKHVKYGIKSMFHWGSPNNLLIELMRLNGIIIVNERYDLLPFEDLLTKSGTADGNISAGYFKEKSLDGILEIRLEFPKDLADGLCKEYFPERILDWETYDLDKTEIVFKYEYFSDEEAQKEFFKQIGIENARTKLFDLTEFEKYTAKKNKKIFAEKNTEKFGTVFETDKSNIINDLD